MPPDAIPGYKLAYVVSRWRFLAVAVGLAALLAFIASEFLPRRYTATTTVIIDPPATSDIRAAASLNPAYLDSLRTFEHFFTSDALFEQAASRFHLDTGGEDVDTLRRRILKVKQQHETRILEISATLPDATAASALVRYITEQSIAASRDHAVSVDRDSMSNLAAELDHARAQLDQAQAEWQRASKDDTPDSIQATLDSAITLQSEIRSHENEAAADAEEWQVRARQGQVSDRGYAQVQAEATTARKVDYEKRRAKLEAEIALERKTLADRSSRLTLASAQLDMARRAFDTAQARLRDFGAVAGMRSERMRMIDRGVVPRKPSSPKVLLNTLASVVLALCLSLGWLVLGAGEARPRPAMVRTAAQRSA
jgi:uncharacterized protein involved in exopolysaccharide biosynthesis